MEKPILTAFRQKKQDREDLIYGEYLKEMAKPEAMSFGVVASLVKKYDLSGYATFYRMKKNAEKRIKAKQVQS